jgi:hypothetical protein
MYRLNEDLLMSAGLGPVVRVLGLGRGQVPETFRILVG